MERAPAIVLANGHYRSLHAKTSHGLVRTSERYAIVGIVDETSAGQDAGELLDGRARGIPIFASVGEALERLADRPAYCIVGVATPGGVLPDALRSSLTEALEAGLSLVNGLHQLLTDDPEFAALARARGCELIDIRKPRPTRDMRFWSGAIHSVGALRVPVLGTDCAVGKRTTALLLRDACRAAGLKAEMVYTGQSGWLQGMSYGFLFDATPNDFVCGELERAVVECWEAERPDVILIEGQSGLRNPSGPCGAELLLAAAASGVLLQHPMGRTEFIEDARAMPSAEDEVALIRMYGVPTWGVTLNTDGVAVDDARAEQTRLRERLGIPVVLPLPNGVDGADGLAELVDMLRGKLAEGSAP